MFRLGVESIDADSFFHYPDMFKPKLAGSTQNAADLLKYDPD